MRLLLLMLGISVSSSALEIAPRPKIIRGARFTAAGWVVAVQTAASQHLNNAWKPRAGSAVCANRIRNTSLHLGRIR